MRLVMRALSKTNIVFWILNILLEFGHVVCLYVPLYMIGFSRLLAFVIAGALFFLDSFGRTTTIIAWIAHLAIWIISINYAVHCPNSRFVTFYIICAALYVLVEIIATLAIVIQGARSSKNDSSSDPFDSGVDSNE